jgi:CheY-like chemotaxis protein/HPt (histidine-containing phosphotransfer) domain-containing protein
MTSLRLLHVDDEPDIREIVAFSLSLDLALSVRSCASGAEALAIAADWSPDMILCDVMMPTMDGPATLARLRECPQTADIPVVFMTARVQASEFERFKSLGAAGVIAKPFDPLALAAQLRSHMPLPTSAPSAARGNGHPPADTFDSLQAKFLERVSRDADVLLQCQSALAKEPGMSSGLNRIRGIAHGLAGAGGIFGFPQLSDAAGDLEEAIVVELENKNPPRTVDRALDRLLTSIAACIPNQIDNARHPTNS